MKILRAILCDVWVGMGKYRRKEDDDENEKEIKAGGTVITQRESKRETWNYFPMFCTRNFQCCWQNFSLLAGHWGIKWKPLLLSCPSTKNVFIHDFMRCRDTRLVILRFMMISTSFWVSQLKVPLDASTRKLLFKIKPAHSIQPLRRSLNKRLERNRKISSSRDFYENIPAVITHILKIAKAIAETCLKFTS